MGNLLKRLVAIGAFMAAALTISAAPAAADCAEWAKVGPNGTCVQY